MKATKYGPLEFTDEECERLFFISDPHFGHANIIRLCQRPFKDLEEMNETLINNWNNTISYDSIVVCLGDFVWGGTQLWKSFLSVLKGQKILILGNHDNKCNIAEVESEFLDIRDILEIRTSSGRLFCCHYPLTGWGGSYHGVYHLYGHIHEKDFNHAVPQQYNCCVERNDYRPISLNEVSLLLTKQVRDNVVNLTLKDIP